MEKIGLNYIKEVPTQLLTQIENIVTEAAKQTPTPDPAPTPVSATVPTSTPAASPPN